MSMEKLCAFCGKYKKPPCATWEDVNSCPNYEGNKKPREETIQHIIAEETAPLFSRTEYNTPRSALLNEAMEIVHKDRSRDYGSPEDNFRAIADLWNAYIKGVCRSSGADVPFPLASSDVPIMMILMKIARLTKSSGHHDSAVDIAGYAACLADIQESVDKTSEPSKSADGPSSTLSWALF